MGYPPVSQTGVGNTTNIQQIPQQNNLLNDYSIRTIAEREGEMSKEVETTLNNDLRDPQMGPFPTTESQMETGPDQHTESMNQQQMEVNPNNVYSNDQAGGQHLNPNQNVGYNPNMENQGQYESLNNYNKMNLKKFKATDFEFGPRIGKGNSGVFIWLVTKRRTSWWP